jgi:hypothetical protein
MAEPKHFTMTAETGSFKLTGSRAGTQVTKDMQPEARKHLASRQLAAAPWHPYFDKRVAALGLHNKRSWLITVIRGAWDDPSACPEPGAMRRYLSDRFPRRKK